MSLTKDRQTFLKAGGILILIQGMVWVALSLAAIIIQSSPPEKLKKTSTEFNSYTEYLSRIIYDYSMTDRHSATISKVIRPGDFQAFLWIYLVLSAIWVAASLDQYFAIRLKKVRQTYITLVLGVAILLTSIIDLVFFSLLARDFSSCPFDLNRDSSMTTAIPATTPAASTTIVQISDKQPITAIDCQVAIGMVMSIVARGYVLWAINVVIGIILISIGTQVLRTPSLKAYSKNTIPRLKLPYDRRDTATNDDLVYFGDNDASTAPAPGHNGRNRANTPISLSRKNNKNLFY